MKKVIFCFVAVCFLFPSIISAQTEKGKVLLGVSSRMGIGLIGTYGMGTGSDLMSFNFSSSKGKSDSGDDSESDKITGINLSPRGGYFFLNNFVAGIDLNLASWIEKYSGSEYKTTSTLFSAGPFARYYLPTKKIKPFVEGFAYFGMIKYKEGGDEGYESKASNNTYGGGLGCAFPIADKISFDLMLGYNSNTIKEKEDNEDNYRMITGTLGIRFGFVFLLGKSKT
jgi:hypothetical protein